MNNLLVETNSATININLSSNIDNKINKNELLKSYKENYKKGKAAKKKKDFALAYVFFKDALIYANLVDWKTAIVYVNLEIADIDLKTDNYERAYKHYMNCLNTALMNDLESLVSVIYFKLSKFYCAKGNSNLSKEYNSRAIKAIGL